MPALLIILTVVLSLVDLNRNGIPDMWEVAGLYRLADALDVTVLVGALPAGWMGAYSHRRRTVTMRDGLCTASFRSVLAHELGHAVLEHAGYALPESIQEREADLFAARHLISPNAAREALEICGTDTIALAQYLNVMPWVVREYSKTPEGMDVLTEYARLRPAGELPHCVMDMTSSQLLMEVGHQHSL